MTLTFADKTQSLVGRLFLNVYCRLAFNITNSTEWNATDILGDYYNCCMCVCVCVPKWWFWFTEATQRWQKTSHNKQGLLKCNEVLWWNRVIISTLQLDLNLQCIWNSLMSSGRRIILKPGHLSVKYKVSLLFRKGWGQKLPYGNKWNRWTAQRVPARVPTIITRQTRGFEKVRELSLPWLHKKE